MLAPQVVPPEKVDKLIGVLLKLYMKIGEVVDDGTESKGACIVIRTRRF